MSAIETKADPISPTRGGVTLAVGLGTAVLAALLAGPVHAGASDAKLPKIKYSFTSEFGANGEGRRPKGAWFSRKTTQDGRTDTKAKSANAATKTVAEVAPDKAAADESRRLKSSFWSLVKGNRGPREAAESARIEPAAAKTTKAAAALSASGESDPGDDTIPEEFTPTVADPMEPVNRITFTLNEGIDFAVFRPVSFVYRTAVPGSVRFGVSNALHNFSTPVIFANDLLQGRPDRAGKTLMRFLINSTAGFGGLADAAAAGGLERHSEDFGQTLAVWGFGQGIYIVVPVLGPTTSRDGFGRLVDLALDPATWLMWNLPVIERLSPTIAYAVSGHEELMDELDSVRKTSPDFYASMRDLYIQKRASEIANGTETLEPIEAEPNR